jgi:hypothetical protein
MAAAQVHQRSEPALSADPRLTHTRQAAPLHQLRGDLRLSGEVFLELPHQHPGRKKWSQLRLAPGAASGMTWRACGEHRGGSGSRPPSLGTLGLRARDSDRSALLRNLMPQEVVAAQYRSGSGLPACVASMWQAGSAADLPSGRRPPPTRLNAKESRLWVVPARRSERQGQPKTTSQGASVGQQQGGNVGELAAGESNGDAQVEDDGRQK